MPIDTHEAPDTQDPDNERRAACRPAPPPRRRRAHLSRRRAHAAGPTLSRRRAAAPCRRATRGSSHAPMGGQSPEQPLERLPLTFHSRGAQTRNGPRTVGEQREKGEEGGGGGAHGAGARGCARAPLARGLRALSLRIFRWSNTRSSSAPLHPRSRSAPPAARAPRRPRGSRRGCRRPRLLLLDHELQLQEVVLLRTRRLRELLRLLLLLQLLLAAAGGGELLALALLPLALLGPVAPVLRLRQLQRRRRRLLHR